MVDKTASFDEVVAAALQLSPIEKVRLVERVISTLENAMATSEKRPLQTFRGVLAHLGPGPSDEEIEEVRGEMLKNFPREDF